MRFYKLTSIVNGEDYYINPHSIDFYYYTNKGVMLIIKNMTTEVLKSDFENMMILEGGQEY